MTSPIVLAALLWSSLAGAAARPLPRIAIQAGSGVSGAARLGQALHDAAPLTASARIAVDLSNDADGWRADAYAASGFTLWVVVDTPASQAGAAAWRARLQVWLAARRGRVALLELRLPQSPLDVGSFAVRAAATDLRARDPSARLAVGGWPMEDAARAAAFLTAELTPYVDYVAVPSRELATGVLTALGPAASGIRAVLIDQTLPASPEAAVTTIADLGLGTISSPVDAIAVVAPEATLAGVLPLLRPLAPLLDGNISELGAASSLRLTVSGQPADVDHRLLFDDGTFGTYLVYTAAAAASPLEVSVNVPVEGHVVVHDLVSGTEAPGRHYERRGTSVRVDVPRTGHPMLVDFNVGATEVFAQRSEVVAERPLSVEEIIARHRQQQAAQDAVLDHYAAAVHMEQHFRPTMTDPGYDVVTENRYFSARDGGEWEELSFSVNGATWGADRPPFPLLQPEKVLSLPLQLRFNNEYRYRLTGTARVDGADCYVVGFEPLDATRSMYRGTVWIDRRSFARVKVEAVQTNLSGLVVANRESHHYAAVASVDGRPIVLLDRLVARQTVLLAGRNLLVEKIVRFDDFVVNGAAFGAARAAARAGDRVMYRDTDRGLRYFVKRDDGTRVVSERPTERAKAIAMGITIDPSFAFPLPIFGINYLDFAFGSEDTQLAVLFGGVLAAVNIQRPKLGRTPFDASLDLFGIAVPSSDRRYDRAGEHPSERVITWPETAGLNLGWQYTPSQKATIQYQIRLDAYHGDTTTSDAFVVPTSTLTNGVGGAWEYRRGGYSFVANGAWYARARWKPWGLPDAARGGALAAPRRRYARYSASLTRDFYLAPFQKLHLNGAYFGGRNLDRFSRYQFGLFDDTRIHGVPASGVRFDELAMARGTYSFNIFDQYRLDGFVEQAWGRDRAAGPAWRPLTGLGLAVNVRAPFDTILRADVGHALLPAGYRGVGSTVVQILLLKPLR